MLTPLRLLLAIALPLGASLVAACATPFQPVDLAALPGAEQYPDEGAVVLFEERAVRFDKDLVSGEPFGVETLHRRVRILGDAGRSWQFPYILYNGDSEELIDFQVRVVTPDGEEKLYAKEKSKDYGNVSPSSVLFSKQRGVGVDVGSVPLGTVVEVRSQVKIKKPDLFSVAHGFERDEPVEVSRLVLDVPADWDVAHQARKGVEKIDWAPERVEDGGRVVLTFEATGLPPLAEEDGVPAIGVPARSVLARLSRWQKGGETIEAPKDDKAMSAWTYEIAKDRSEPTDKIRALHAEIVKGVPADDKEARVRALYTWTQSKVQYCAAYQDALEGFVAHEVDDIAESRYGDCKDKAALLQALLGAEGVQSRFVDVFAHDGLPRPFTLAALDANFNHVILAVEMPNGRVYADPTTRTVPFGRLPPEDQGAEVLVLTKEGEPLAKTPESAPDENSVVQRFTLALGADGRAKGAFEATFQGAYADVLRHHLLFTRPEDEDEAIEDDLDVDGTDVVVRSHAFTDREYDGRALPLGMKGEVEVTLAMVGPREARLLDAAALTARELPILVDDERTAPLGIGWRRSKTLTYDLALPSGMRVVSVPAPDEVTSPWGSYRLAWTKTDRGLRLERALRVEQRVVQAADYAAFKSFVDRVRAMDGAAAVLAEGN